MSVRRLVLLVFGVVFCAVVWSAPAFAAPLEAPEVTVQLPVPAVTASLHGVLNPHKARGAGTYEFLYKPGKAGCAGGSKTPVPPGLMTGVEHEEVNESLSGLTPGTEYSVCLRAVNTTSAPPEEAFSPVVTFTTAIPPEVPVTSSPAKSVTATTAILEGTLNPVKAGEAGTYEFLYRVSSSECEGERSSPAPAGVMSGAVKQAVSVNLSALQPNAAYTFCLLARNAAGETAVGSLVHFTTPPAAPTVESEAASNIKATEARLEALVNPNNQTTECRFQYEVEEPSLKAPTTRLCEPGSFTAVFGGQSAGLSLGGLEAHKTYYYRVIAENEQSRKEGKPAEGAIQHFTTAFPPETPETKPASPVTTNEATLHGVLNPASNHESEPGSYEFVYRQSTTGCQGANEKTTTLGTPLGHEGEHVEAKITGLLPGAAYTFCPLVRNSAGETAVGSPVTFTTLAAAPLIEESSVSDVASSSATLSAKIDPDGSQTTYRFEYGTSEAYGSSIPVPDGIVGSGSAGVTVSAHPQDLLPSAEYHYRVVAVVASRSETVPGSDGTFTTQPAGGGFELPEHRQWELVSPTKLHGALIQSLGGLDGSVVQAAEDGTAITYQVNVPTEPEPQGYVIERQQTVSRRGPHGWSTRDIATQHDSRTGFTGQEHNPEYSLFSGDLSVGLAAPVGEDGTLLSPEASEPTAYLRHESLCDAPATVSECFQPLVTGKEGFADVPPGTKFYDGNRQNGFEDVRVEGASPDLSHVVLSDAAAPLTSSPATEQLYEWSADAAPTEALQLVSLLPASEGGGPSPNKANLGGGAYFDEAGWTGARHAVSNDGSRVFWEACDRGFVCLSLYMRDTVKGETVRLDVPQPGAPPPNGAEEEGVKFQIASDDGSKVFFTDDLPLTAHSGVGVYGSRQPDLYECEIVEEAGRPKCDLTDLTPESSPGDYADVKGSVVGASEDGSYVYFVAAGVLGDGAERGATQGLPNLYEDHEGKVTFITSLSEEDETDWNRNERWGVMGSLTARVSPNGRYVAFMSSRSLTGYDNLDAVSDRPDQEVYLYDAVNERLACVSCNPTGSRPTGVAKIEFSIFGKGPGAANVADVVTGEPEDSWVAANLPAADVLGSVGPALYQTRLLSDSGRLFFNSSDALVPQDVNDQEDVYEFEPEGTGGCTASNTTFNDKTGGCVGLISSGTSPEESGFLDASEGGGDVFFLTTAKLVAADDEHAYEVYDAHECTAVVPCVTEPVSPPPCDSGDSCKAAPLPQPAIYGAPASETFTGAGNVVPEAPKAKEKPKTVKCGKGQVRKHGKCFNAKKKKRKTRGKAKKSSRRSGR
jgi:hypothetical protein